MIGKEFGPVMTNLGHLNVPDPTNINELRSFLCLLNYHHKLVPCCHPGIARMKAQAKGYVWWPNIDTDIEHVAKACVPFVEVPPPVNLHPWVWPTEPWKRIYVDFVGPTYGKTFLAIIDAHSKWPEVWEMASTSARKTVGVIRHLFSLYGLPDKLVSDNGPQL